MPFFFSPLIKQDDYQAFRDIIGSDMPDTFGVWSYQRTEADAQQLSGGTIVRRIEVNPDCFVEYLRAHRTKASRHELDNFTFHEATRMKRDEE